jgi:hypothetical protein
MRIYNITAKKVKVAAYLFVHRSVYSTSALLSESSHAAPGEQVKGVPEDRKRDMLLMPRTLLWIRIRINLKCWFRIRIHTTLAATECFVGKKNIL